MNPVDANVTSNVHGGHIMKLPFGLDATWLAYNPAPAGAIGVVLLWNYFVNRRWTFGDVT